MAKIDAKKLIELINDTDFYAAREYSGRGMFGKKCVGVSVDDPYEFITSFLNVARVYEDKSILIEAIDLIADIHDDSLGRGVILYWRSIEWPKDLIRDEFEEDENED